MCNILIEFGKCNVCKRHGMMVKDRICPECYGDLERFKEWNKKQRWFKEYKEL